LSKNNDLIRNLPLKLEQKNAPFTKLKIRVKNSRYLSKKFILQKIRKNFKKNCFLGYFGQKLAKIRE